MVLEVKNLPANAGDTGDMGSIPRSGGCPRGEHGNLHQYSCLENPMDGGAWWATVHGVAKSRTRLSDFTSLQLSPFNCLYINSSLKHLSNYKLNQANLIHEFHKESATPF